MDKDNYGINGDKDMWERNKKIVNELKGCPSMPDWWRYGYDSKEDMEDELNRKR